MATAPDPLASSMSGLGVSTRSSAPFTLSGSDSSSVDEDAPLPFPEALPRADFLAPDFQPAAYLSALSHRHQTLEDLRSDLRDRSAAISSELLELVNSNYTAFLSLGSELRGGDDKVEDVKVSLLGFRRAVEEVKTRVSERKEETNTLNGELRGVRSAIEQGRKMIELSERLTSLEERLSLDSLPADQREWDDESEDEEEDNDGNYGSSPTRLLASAQECSRIAKIIETLGPDTPFVIKMEERLTRCRNTLLLDLSHALKEAKKAGVPGQDRILKCLAVYRVLDAQSEAIKTLRGS
ncbi:hypothetical protein F66182_6631 [Fusarium sp. NRRL 66182]|nr:hypothetical protein F66182_6631 [Fusarium sp. NRRL 66182]